MKEWIERQKNILDFTLSSLLRRKGKNAALILIYTLVVFMLASVLFFVQSIKMEASIILQDAPEGVIQRTIAGRHDLIPLGYMDKVRTIKGISSIRGRLWGYYYDPTAGANYTFMVPEDYRLGPGKALIGQGVSRMRSAGKGDLLGFMAFDGSFFWLEIKNVISPASELVSSDLVLVAEKDFRRLFGIPKGYATDLILKVKNQRELPTIARKISGFFPDTRVILREEILRTYETVFNWRGGMVMVIFAGAFLAFIIFAWDKASGLSSEEKREIGILKGIGWETSNVIQMKFWEGMVVSLTSFLLGIILAYIHVFFTSAVLFEPVLKGWGVLYPKFNLTPFIEPSQIVTLFLLAVVPYTVATVIPSWKAATADPDFGMR